MNFKTAWLVLAAGAVLLAGAGCGDPRTQEPSQDEIRKAVERRRKAIDDNPNYTPEMKEMLKSRITGGEPKSNAPAERK